MLRGHSNSPPKPDCMIAFIATNPDWGGSEELWSQTAHFLAKAGICVEVAVQRRHKRIEELASSGVNVHLFATKDTIIRRLWGRASSNPMTFRAGEVERALGHKTPALTVVADGGSFRSIDVLELLSSKGLPFVTVTQAVNEDDWPDDDLARRHRIALSAARRCYFVSEGNRRLFETQLGAKLEYAEIVRNPFNVSYNVAPPWPELTDDGELRLACVGRLHPPSKGQHILLEALSDGVWRYRNWHLSLFGNGSMKESIERMIANYGLQDRVHLAGYHASIVEVWKEHHLLVMPSRYEGLPLAMVEAMLCYRPVLATDVAGHAEIVEDGVTGFLADAPTSRSILRSLNEVWAKRNDLNAMGQAAGLSIRRRVSPNPSLDFAEKIKRLAEVARNTA